MKISQIFKDECGKSFLLELSMGSTSISNDVYWSIGYFERKKGHKKWQNSDTKLIPKEWIEAIKNNLFQALSHSFEEKFTKID